MYDRIKPPRVVSVVRRPVGSKVRTVLAGVRCVNVPFPFGDHDRPIAGRRDQLGRRLSKEQQNLRLQEVRQDDNPSNPSSSKSPTSSSWGSGFGAPVNSSRTGSFESPKAESAEKVCVAGAGPAVGDEHVEMLIPIVVTHVEAISGCRRTESRKFERTPPAPSPKTTRSARPPPLLSLIPTVSR